jgi:hypothetical protein
MVPEKLPDIILSTLGFNASCTSIRIARINQSGMCPSHERMFRRVRSLIKSRHVKCPVDGCHADMTAAVCEQCSETVFVPMGATKSLYTTVVLTSVGLPRF